jgi:integrase
VATNRRLQRSIHTITSDGRNIIKRFKRKEQRLPLDYDKYLIGRSYDLFKSAIRSDKSLQLYKQFLFHFCNFIKMTTDEIVSKYNSNENARESIKLQYMIEDYAIHLQRKVTEGKISAHTCKVAISPIKLLCDMNDIILNFRKIRKLLPHGNSSAADEAYSREQIKKMLEFADLRTKIPILFMASSGMRLGGFQVLTDGCIKPICDEKSGKLVAAHVVIYKGSDDEYDTFVSPEAYRTYEEYRNLRIKFGEKVSKNSPVLLRRFDVSQDGKNVMIDNSKHLALPTLAGIIKTVAYKAGVREASEKYNDRYNIKIAHGFRKFFSSTLSNIKTPDGRNAIDFIKKEWLLGHSLTGIHTLEENYNRNDRVNLLLDEYLKAVKEVTISDEERLKVEVKKLQTDISNMKTVEVQLAAKDKEMQSMREEMNEMSQQFNQIMSMVQHNPKLSQVKPEALKKKL